MYTGDYVNRHPNVVITFGSIVEVAGEITIV
jgi:hypothetical protein